MNKKILSFLSYGIPILIAGLIKIVVWSPEITPFNADEAIVALMAKHINQGQLPIFFYGQAYLGSLDAILIALGFRMFGESVGVIRLVQSLLYLGTILTAMILAKRLLNSRRAAFYTGLLLAIPPINVTLYTTASLGGYGEMLLMGNMLLLGGISIADQIQNDKTDFGQKFYLGVFLWSIGAGFAFWVFGLILVYIIPVMLVFIWVGKKRSARELMIAGLMLLAGGSIGSSPWWGSAILSGNFGILAELAGSAISNSSRGFSLIQPLNRLVNLIIFGGSAFLGLRPPWAIQWLMLPLIPVVLIFWFSVFVNCLINIRKKGDQTGLNIIALMGLVFSAGFIFSPYGDDPSGRYFLPLIIPMVIFGADLVVNKFPGKRILEYIGIGLILIFNLGGTLQSISKNPPGLTTQFDAVAQIDQSYMDELIVFLTQNHIKYGYSNYWVSYPLNFLSNEEIIFIPRLPYHEDFRYTARDDRYGPYSRAVESAIEVAYITTNHPDLDKYIRDQFSVAGILWEEKRIGDFQVFYDLSKTLHAADIGLGVTTIP